MKSFVLSTDVAIGSLIDNFEASDIATQFLFITMLTKLVQWHSKPGIYCFCRESGWDENHQLPLSIHELKTKLYFKKVYIAKGVGEVVVK